MKKIIIVLILNNLISNFSYANGKILISGFINKQSQVKSGT